VGDVCQASGSGGAAEQQKKNPELQNHHQLPHSTATSAQYFDLHNSHDSVYT
jgi:hypothetical protein